MALFTKATRSTEAELLVEQVVGLLVGETTGLHLALRHAVAGLDRRPVWRRTVRVSWRHDTLGVCLCGSSPGGTQRYRGGCGGARVIIPLRQSALYSRGWADEEERSHGDAELEAVTEVVAICASTVNFINDTTEDEQKECTISA